MGDLAARCPLCDADLGPEQRVCHQCQVEHLEGPEGGSDDE